MCKCTPGIRTPYCGKGDCVWPNQTPPQGARTTASRAVQEARSWELQTKEKILRDSITEAIGSCWTDEEMAGRLHCHEGYGCCSIKLDGRLLVEFQELPARLKAETAGPEFRHGFTCYRPKWGTV